MSAIKRAGVALVAACALALAGCSASSDFKASVASIRATTDTQVGVAVSVKNAGTDAASATCNVGVYADANTDLGDNTVDLPTIKAGATWRGTILVDVKPGTPDPASSVIVCN